MSYPLKRVAVIGVTGMLGLPVARALAEAGFDVTAMVREPEGARGKLPVGIATVAADVKDGKSLAFALAGVDAVHVSLSMTPAQTKRDFRLESEGMRAIVAACRIAGVSRISYLSSIMQKNSAMDWWSLEMKREAVAILQRGSIDFSIFYPANFMESIPLRMRQGGRIAIAGKPRETSYWVAAADYAAQVAAALRRAEPGLNQEYTVQGLEAFRADEAAQEFVDNYVGEKLSVARAPLAIFSFLGLFSPTMDYVRHISEALNTTPEPFAADRTWAERQTQDDPCAVRPHVWCLSRHVSRPVNRVTVDRPKACALPIQTGQMPAPQPTSPDDGLTKPLQASALLIRLQIFDSNAKWPHKPPFASGSPCPISGIRSDRPIDRSHAGPSLGGK